jgi:hypothetical protein
VDPLIILLVGRIAMTAVLKQHELRITKVRAINVNHAPVPSSTLLALICCYGLTKDMQLLRRCAFCSRFVGLGTSEMGAS